ncbi:MAG: hypothetical protein EA406_14575 [Rhodospirillales bacterium]|nr:MAG: hypothetical protein EA406_14575 [Rhodospirillales bacterium]
MGTLFPPAIHPELAAALSEMLAAVAPTHGATPQAVATAADNVDLDTAAASEAPSLPPQGSDADASTSASAGDDTGAEDSAPDTANGVGQRAAELLRRAARVDPPWAASMFLGAAGCVACEALPEPERESVLSRLLPAAVPVLLRAHADPYRRAGLANVAPALITLAADLARPATADAATARAAARRRFISSIKALTEFEGELREGAAPLPPAHCRPPGPNGQHGGDRASRPS